MSVNLAVLSFFGVWALIVFLRLVIFPKSREDQPGPHNNWRKNTRGSSDTSENSSVGGVGGFDCGGSD